MMNLNIRKEVWSIILIASLTFLLTFSNTILLAEGLVVHWILALFFALGFSLTTASIINLYPNWLIYSMAGLLDAVIVYLKIEDNIGIVYAAYTFFIVVVTGIVAERDKNTEEPSEKKTINRLQELLSDDYRLKLITSKLDMVGHISIENSELLEILNKIAKDESTEEETKRDD